MAKLTLIPTDHYFKENLQALRRHDCEVFLNVVRNGKGYSAVAARIIETGFGGEVGFGFTGDDGETRCLLSEIDRVEAYL